MRLLLPLARQWIAGPDLEDAVQRAEESNRRDVGAILNNLGEHMLRREAVEACVWEYHAILRDIKAKGLDACISVKPTQLGLSISEAYCWEILRELLGRCQRDGVFLWLDMEGSHTTVATLRLYAQSRAIYEDTGLALQANLRRTLWDLHHLLPDGIVRLVKGAYREPATVAFQRKSEIDQSFLTLMRMLFEEGRRFALATHDDRMIATGQQLQEHFQRDLEFQMLLGVRDPLKKELRGQGYRVLEYIPYGPRWLPYFTRRLGERPRNVITMFRSLVGP